MITDWVINPFGHLRGGHYAMHAAMMHAHTPENGIVRRRIFVGIEGIRVDAPSDLFPINARRVLDFMIDVDGHNLTLLEVKELPHGSGWGKVPTPVF